MRRARRILALLALAVLASGHGLAEETNAFWFVQIADTHFGVAGNDARARRVVEEINRLPMPIDFVLHTGDVFADNILKPEVLHTATSTLARLTAPLYVVSGNHDIVPGKLAATLAAYTNAMGPLCGSVDSHGVRFLWLETESLRGGYAIAGYDPLAWLTKQLQAAGDKPVIVCTHSPPVEDLYKNKAHPGWPSAVRAKWNRTLRLGRICAVLTGHFHRDELHWEGGIPVYVGGPVASFWGRQGSYRIYEYRDGRLSYSTCYLE